MGKSIGLTPRSTVSSPVQNLRPAGGRPLLPATPANVATARDTRASPALADLRDERVPLPSSLGPP
jgi:hypothetical protein